MTAVLLSFGAFLSTMLGGIFALRFQTRLGSILAFAAGVLLGVVAFDIIPEIFELSRDANADPNVGMISLVAGLIVFNAFHQRMTSIDATAQKIGVFAGLVMSGHSLMDGVSIGLAFQISSTVGLLVAMAVITHDFCDGINTVGVMLAHGNSARRASRILVLGALAPVVGVLSTRLFHIPPVAMIGYLGIFAGFLLFIAISTLGHSVVVATIRKSPIATFVLTFFGSATVFLVVQAGA